MAYENHRRTFWIALGPKVKYARNKAADDTLIATTKPYGFGNFGEAGARLRFEMDTRGRSLIGMGAAGLAPGATLSDTGVKLELDGRVYPKAWDVEETFSTASGAMTGILAGGVSTDARGQAGGQKVWGKYPWFEAAFLGGSDNVRGYGRETVLRATRRPSGTPR